MEKLTTALMVLGLFFLSAFVHGQYLQVSNSNIGITSCTSGYSTIYVTGVNSGDTVYFSSNSANLQTNIYPQNELVDGSGSASAQVSITSPACFLGNVPINVIATVCDSNFNCQTLNGNINVVVSSCTNSQSDCSNNNQISINSNEYSNTYTPCSGTSCTYQSQYSNYANYGPSQFSASVMPINNLPVQMIGGSASNVKFKIENSGTEGTFQITLNPSNSAMFSINPSPIIADISSGGYSVESFSINSNSNTPTGTYQFDVQVSHDGTQIADYPFFIQVVSPSLTSIQIYLPSQNIQVSSCNTNGNIQIPVQLVLQGANNQQSAVISASISNNEIYSSSVVLNPQTPQDVALNLPNSAFTQKNNTIVLSVNSNGVSESTEFNLNLVSCQQPLSQLVEIDSVYSNIISNNQLIETVQITNNNSQTLYNLTGQFVGIPANLNFTSSSINQLGAGQTENLSITMEGSNFAEQNVTLQILSSVGMVASSVVLISAYSSQNGATGFFTLFTLSSSDSLLLLVLILALIPAFLLISAAKQNNKVHDNIKKSNEKKQPPSNPSTDNSIKTEQKSEISYENETQKYVARMRKLRGNIQNAATNA